MYNGGKHCHHPAYKSSKKEGSFCNEHALKAHLFKAKQGTRMQPPKNAESILSSLSHYVMKPKAPNQNLVTSSTYRNSDDGKSSPDFADAKVTKALDPLVDIDASSVIASCSDVLDLCSDSESDIEATTLSNVWLDAHADSSEDESIDSDNEDFLKHANVLSAEEVTQVAKDKLIRLHSLYVNQYSHLCHLLKEKRRHYLHAIKKEKETCCSMRSQALERPKDMAMFKKLKAYNQYHRKHGVDAILRKRLIEIRMKITEGLVYKPTSHSCRCTFSEGGIKCTERALPVAKHCRKHILKDPNQVLFRACGKKGGEVVCTAAVESIFENQSCTLHREIPPKRVYSQLRKESESDMEEILDNKHVKTEFLHQNDSIDDETDTKDESLSADEDALATDSAPEMKDEAMDESSNEDVDVETTLDEVKQAINST